MASSRRPGPAGFFDGFPTHARADVRAVSPGPTGQEPIPLGTVRRSRLNGYAMREFWVDASIANARALTQRACRSAEGGLTIESLTLLRPGTVLYRIGSSQRPNAANFSSPWWITESSFQKILRKGMQDTAWAARVTMAIAEAWGSPCDLQVRVRVATSLYALSGLGKVISKQGKSVPAHHPDGHWFPDPDVEQLYIPGLKSSFFDERTTDAWLPIGTQRNLATGKPYVPRSQNTSALPPDAHRR